MLLLSKLKKLLFKLVLAEKSAKKLTLSFCIGNFIAWTPTIPLQTPLIFIFSWLFSLNTTVVFTATYLINNPFATIPIYVIDYYFGKWVLQDILCIDTAKYNPVWINKFDNWLNSWINLKCYLGNSTLCLLCLLVGGFLISIITSIILYPIMRVVFSRLIKLMDKHN